jgi:hypothetical protein
MVGPAKPQVYEPEPALGRDPGPGLAAPPLPHRKRAATRRARRLALFFCCVATLLGVGALLPPGADAAGQIDALTWRELGSPLAGVPAAGWTFADPIVLSATVSGDVVGVQFQLDGANLGPEILTPPFEMTWDVRTVPNRNYVLSAVPRGTAGEQGVPLTALVTVWAVSQHASVFSSRPFPFVRDRLGRIPRDYVWAGTPATVVDRGRLGYIAYDRDLVIVHDLSWFTMYHPDWLMYTCDKKPIRYFGRPFLVLDIMNPAVREYQYRIFVRNHMKRGLYGIAIDNFAFLNYNGKCGVYDENGSWHQRYTGELDDPEYIEDVIAWLTWMVDRVRADGGLVALNLVEPLHPALDRAASKVDLVYFEGGGFINTFCAPAWTDEGWLKKFQVFRKIALERALAVEDQTCDYISQLTPELVSWDAANFFLVRGDRSYFGIAQSYVRRPPTDPHYDGPEPDAPLGEPLGEPQQQGTVWLRHYENGVVLVNPSSTNSGAVSLGAHRFADLQGRTFTGDVTVPPASGLVLLRSTPDVAVYRGPTGQWRVLRSKGGGASIFTWGDPAQLDVPLSGDFDGDGQGDVAVYRESTGQWFVLHSGGGATILTWGDPFQHDVPVPADYDGDGRADIAVYRESTGQWFVLHSGGGATILTWGDPFQHDVPVPADYDGDGRADITVYRGATGQWFILHSAGGVTIVTWGDPHLSDLPVPADYDGDGRVDIAVYRGVSGRWFVLSSGGGVKFFSWGDPALGDLPRPLLGR